MKRALATAAAVLTLSAPAPAAPPAFTTIATDPPGDVVVGTYDITALKARRSGANLEIRFELPTLNTTAASATTLWVEWRFATGGAMYAISGSPLAYTSAQPTIELSSFGVGSEDYYYETIQELEGGFNEEDGYVWALLPLKAIGAKRGTVLKPAKGVGKYQFWTYSTVLDIEDVVPITKSYRIP